MQLLTVADVAHELGVSPRLVTKWIDAGSLRAIEGVGRGRGLRIERAWLDAFIAEREKRTRTSIPNPRSRATVLLPLRSVRDARAELLGKP